MATESTSIHEYCVGLLTSRSLAGKLTPPVQANGDPLIDGGEEPLIIEAPARCDELQMVGRVGRLPAIQQLVDPIARRACLARFAHHELQAVELFAWALLAWPAMPEVMRRGFLQVIGEEQRHMTLYLARLEALGAELSDEPLSDFFWRHAPAILASDHGPRAFICAMGLTLEQANLDYTLYYKSAFAHVGDDDTAVALQQVHDDEVQHVAHAYRWLDLIKEPGLTQIEAYREYAPFPFSASRARGKGFDEAGRLEAGLSEDFIEYVRAARHYGTKFNQAVEGALLLPNLVERNWKRARFDPNVVQISALWRLLFSNAARVIDAPHAEAPWWPEELGSPPKAPAFAVLEDAGRLVPWRSTPELVPFCEKRKLRNTAAEAQTSARVADRAYALAFAQQRSLVPERLAGLARALDPADFADAKAMFGEVETVLSRWPDWARRTAVLCARRGRFDDAPDGIAAPRDWQAFVAHHPVIRRAGGFILEPGLETLASLVACFFIAEDRDPVLLGSACRRVDAIGEDAVCFGQLERDGRMHSGHACDEAFLADAWDFARQAAADGYFGPLEVAARTLRDPVGGDELFQPVFACSPRYSLGLICLGLVRRVCEAGLLEPLTAAEGLAWRFELGAISHGPAEPAAEHSLALDLSAPQHPARSLRAVLGFRPRTSALH